MNLLQAVVAVALAATVTIGGIQYVGADTEARVKATNTADTGFQSLESAFRARQAAGLPIPAAEGWEAALFPAFGTLPTPLKGLTWTYGTGTAGTWFCLSGTTQDRVTKEALERLKARYPDGLYAYGPGCAGKDGTAGAVAATFWVVKGS
ncbi:hypothetical protein [Azospirillum sp. sgz302134]